MRFERKPSFTRQYQKLDESSKEYVTQALQKLLRFFEIGERAQGLGLKQLRKPYWEVRSGLQLRIIFQLEKDLVKFILVGNHDDVKRFLRAN